MAKAPPPSAITEWGVPDPRDATAYPPVAGTQPPQWAWEFLRRREDYRRCWAQLKREQGHRTIVGNDSASRSISRAEAGAAVSAGKTIEWRSLSEVLRAGFRVYPSPENETLDPRESGAPLFEGAEIVYEIQSISEVKFPQVGILFDVSLSLRPQIDSALKLLTQLANTRSTQRSPSRRPQFGLFPRYLRLLDFHAVGTIDQEIGKHLFHSEEGERLRVLIRDNLQQAQRWRDNYLLIALHSPAGS